MPYIKVNPSAFDNMSNTLRNSSNRVSGIESDFSRIGRKLDWDVRSASSIQRRIDSIQSDLENYVRELGNMHTFITKTKQKYSSAQNAVHTGGGGRSGGAGSSREFMQDSIRDPQSSTLEKFKSEFANNYDLSDALSGAGYIGTIYDFYQDIKRGKSWRDFAQTGVDIYQFASGAARTYSNYKRIGNAVGTTKAMTWWAKSITGIKPLGRASTAKTPILRFKNNLTNRTSPFNAQIKNVVGNFSGANGVGKAVASWAAVAVDGVMNWFSNKEEQANSNGTMSNARVVAETITETAVGTVLTYGAGIVVGAAITTIIGPVAAPGVLVVALSGLAVAGINAGVTALTGKSATEWVSDTILDTGKAIGKEIQSTTKAIGNWFGKFSFT